MKVKYKISPDKFKIFSNKINIPQNSFEGASSKIFNFPDIVQKKFPIINSDSKHKFTYDKYPGNPKDIAKIKKYILKPNHKQKHMLLSWIEAYNKMYNLTVNFIHKKRKNEFIRFNKEIKYSEMKYKFDITSLKKSLKNPKKRLIKQYGIQSHTIDLAINDALVMLKSIITNMERGHIKNARLRLIKDTKPTKIMKIPKDSLAKSGFCVSKLGEMISYPQIEDYKKAIDKASVIKYDYRKDIFTLFAKVNVKKEKIDSKNKVICLDPGTRTLFTGITENSVVEIGKNLDKKIRKELKIIDSVKKKSNVASINK